MYVPAASPVPLPPYPEEGGRGTPGANLARANPRWKAPACPALSQGEQGRATPSPSGTKRTARKVVPTRNEETVHAWGAPAVRAIPIARIEGRWTVSLNRGEGDRRGVVGGLRDADDPHRDPRVAALVERRARG